LASCKPNALIKMLWFGIEAAIPFNSANFRLAVARRFNMIRDSKQSTLREDNDESDDILSVLSEGYV